MVKKKASTAVRLDSMPIKPIVTVKSLLFQFSLWYCTTLVELNLARLTVVVGGDGVHYEQIDVGYEQIDVGRT